MHKISIRNTQMILNGAFLFLLLYFLFSPLAEAKNGFDLTGAIIPIEEIFQGGPPKDGIPALSKPTMISAANADYLHSEDRLLGIVINGVARAYPIRILNWHEIVNDNIGEQHYAITYCPLCGTGVVFNASIAGQTAEFGVSGLLYNSDVLLYDKKTASLWSQILGQAVSGHYTGDKLKRMPVTHTNWSDWQRRHPATTVMSINTGHFRDYDHNPYQGYEKSRGIYFSVKNKAPDNYHPKEVVLGIEIDGQFKAYPFIEITRQNQSQFSDEFAGTIINFNWDKTNRVLEASDSSGNAVIGVEGFWFAWFAFHPQTEIFTAQ